ncbi:MAG: S9 family peptidase [Pirellulales bacterium]|nr:S9 family peptidase [Pirellulales bacterium]
MTYRPTSAWTFLLIALLFVVAVMATSPGFAQDSPQDAKHRAETKRGLQPQDFYKEVTIESSALSPDGSLLAFTVMTIVEEENTRHREIWMQRLADGKPVDKPYRFTSPAVESSGPAWSPDGKLLMFRSRRGGDRNSIWFLRVTAPGGEAFHLDGVDSTPIWSPDGKWIAMVKRGERKDDAGPENNKKRNKRKKRKEDKAKDQSQGEPDVRGREGWISPDSVSKTLSKQRFDGRVITSMRYKRDGVSNLIPDRPDREKSQVFIVSAKGGKPKQITETPFDVGNVVWSADSKSLYFVGNEQQDDEYNIEYTSEVYTVARSGGDVRKVTNQRGSERGLAISPDGKQMAYLFSPERGAQTDLYLVELADGRFRGEPRNLTADWEYSPGSPRWINDDTLRMSAQMHGNSHVFEVTVGDGRLRQVTAGDRTLTAFTQARDADLIAYASNDPTHVTELYLASADGTGETRLTSFNDDWLSEVTLMPAERLTWTVADGTGVEGWLIKPVGYEPGKSYPMILKIHGGPHSAYGNYWFRTFHILSNSGFFVLYTNPRGSAGYGHDFTYATRDKWGEMDSEDYLTGVETALAKYPDIDPERLGVSGGSYGGFMTNWLTATTDRFAAAVTSRSISNWNSWYGSSDAQGLTEYEFHGYPWETRETYNRLSPLSYVENVTAPTLIIHSEEDYRTPITDAEQWYIALKKRRVPVEFVRYPRSSHGLSRTGEPWLLVDRLERLRSWFDHWLIGEQGE